MKHGKTELIIAGHIVPDPEWHTRNDRHEYHELIIIVRGKMRVSIAGEIIDACTGDALFYPAGVVHNEQSDKKDPVETFFVAFTGDYESSKIPLRLTDTYGRLRMLSQWIRMPSDIDTIPEQQANSAFFQALLAEYLRLARQKSSSMAVKVREFVRQKTGERVTLDMLAQHAGLSKFHFLRLYREETGQTPMKDVLRMQAEYARSLILASDFPIKLVASMAGFSGPQEMSRIFSRLFDCPPGKFRRNHGV
jgi:AraC family transcriptional regulator, arabinose operon regulatory protein